MLSNDFLEVDSRSGTSSPMSDVVIQINVMMVLSVSPS